MKNKKIIYTASTLIVLLGITYGITSLKGNTSPTVDGCVTDVSNLIYEHPSKDYPQPSFVARTVFTKYLNSQKALPNCKESGLKDFTITTIGEPYFKSDGFMIKVKIDFIPRFPENNVWINKDTTSDGVWIRGREFNLGIRQASTTYMLVP